MVPNRSVLVRFVLLLTAMLGCALGAAAQSYRAESFSAPPPEELAPAVREVLSSDAIRVVGPQGPVCEIWLRKVVPGLSSPSQELGVTFGQLAEGTLVGAMRLPNEVKDYRRQLVKAGVYTFRYALLANDGNHMGVAPQRDFLLASPAPADQNPADLTREAAINLSRKTTGANHPSVWSLAPPEDTETPRIIHQEDGDLWLVQFKVTVQSGGAAQVTMALVVVGHAPEA